MYIATKVSGKSSNSPSASLGAKQLLKLPSPTVVASWAAWVNSTASLHAIAWRHALGTSVSTKVVGRPWPAAFPSEHGKPAELRMSSRCLENSDSRKNFFKWMVQKPERARLVLFCMWVAVKNGDCDSSQFSSINGVCSAHTIWFNKAGSRGSRVVCACTCHFFPWWIWQLPSMYAHSFQSGTFLAKCGGFWWEEYFLTVVESIQAY